MRVIRIESRSMDVPFAALEFTELELRLLRTVLGAHSGDSIGRKAPSADCDPVKHGLAAVPVDRLNDVSFQMYDRLGDALKWGGVK